MCTAFFTSSLRMMHATNYFFKASSQQAKVMQKIIQGTVKKKTHRPFIEENRMPQLSELLGKKEGTNTKVSVRRRSVLNSLFAERITEFLSCSKIDLDLDESKFYITKVNYAIDGSALHVYWSADKDVEKIPTILPALGGQLRHELSQLQSGRVPHINFIYDKSTYRATDVEELLKRADFGPEHYPVDRLTDETVESKTVEKITKRTNVLGLDREFIMKQIMRSMNAAAKHEDHKNMAIDDSCRAVDFKKYIHEQRVLQAKKRRKETFDPDVTSILNSQRSKDYEEYDEDTYEDEDSFLEEEDTYEDQVK